MTTNGYDPLSGTDLDDRTKPGIKQSLETEVLDEEMVTEAYDPVPQHLDSPTVHISTQTISQSTPPRAELEGMDEEDTEARISNEAENDAQPEGTVVEELNSSEGYAGESTLVS